MPRVNIELPDELHRKVKIACAVKDLVLRQYIEEAIREALKNDKNQY